MEVAEKDRTIAEADLSACLGPLQRYALLLTRNEDQAMDLVQDCVERCWRKQHLFDGRNLRSWMFTVCRRLFINQQRSKAVRGTSVAYDDAPPAAISDGERQTARLQYMDVLTELEALSVADQAVIDAVGFQGMPYGEAADHLGIPVGTVRSRLSRARSKLCERLLDTSPHLAAVA